MADQNVSIEVPAVRRVSYDEHASAAASRISPSDPIRAGQVKAEAVRLEPLQRIQVAFDQLQRQAEGHARGVVWDHASSTFASYAADVIDHVGLHRDALVAAADAAESMIGEMTRQLDEQGDAMAQKKADAEAEQQQEAPQLTTDGNPHPLVAGGYDANADPNLSPETSDVEALKEGKATHAQTEAMGLADGAASDEDAGDEGETAEGDEAGSSADKPKSKRGRKKS